MATLSKVPIVLTPQPDGGYTVTSPVLPEFVTEGDTRDDALAHVKDALATVIEFYEDIGKPLPAVLRQERPAEVIAVEYPVGIA